MRNRILILLVVAALSTWAALSWGSSSPQEPFLGMPEADSNSMEDPSPVETLGLVRDLMHQPSSATLFLQPDCIPVEAYECHVLTSAGDSLPIRPDALGMVDWAIQEDFVQLQIQGAGWEPLNLSAEDVRERKEVIVKALRKVSVAVYSKRSELPIENFRLTFTAGTLDSEGNFNSGWMKKTFDVKDSNGMTLGGYSREKGYQSHFQIRIEADGYPHHYSEAVPISKGEDWVTLELRLDELEESTFMVQGVVLNTAGLPLEGATCSLVPEPVSWDYISSWNGKVDLAGFIDPRKADLDKVKTDSNGEFQITSQRFGEYSLLVEYPGRPFSRLPLGELAPGRDPGYLTVRLEDPCSLLVRLTYPEGVPPDSYSVKLIHGLLFKAEVTNPSPWIREFQYLGVRPGNAELILSHHAEGASGQSSFMVLEKREIQIQEVGENLETFNLDPALQNDGIAVKVPIVNGIQNQHWTLLLKEAGHGGQGRSALVSADGFANFENVTEGKWEITGIAFHEEEGIFVVGFGTFDTQDRNVTGVVPLNVFPSQVHIRFPNTSGVTSLSELKLFAKTQDPFHQRFLEGFAQSSLSCRSPISIFGLPEGTYSASINGQEGEEWTLGEGHEQEVHLEF
ncbi:MAG: hypothetical protein O3A50_02230 [Planctomycetota bacterium]|nr:hypothetical protein [Planctomycetota bacterium]